MGTLGGHRGSFIWGLGSVWGPQWSHVGSRFIPGQFWWTLTIQCFSLVAGVKRVPKLQKITHYSYYYKDKCGSKVNSILYFDPFIYRTGMSPEYLKYLRMFVLNSRGKKEDFFPFFSGAQERFCQICKLCSGGFFTTANRLLAFAKESNLFSKQKFGTTPLILCIWKELNQLSRWMPTFYLNTFAIQSINLTELKP